MVLKTKEIRNLSIDEIDEKCLALRKELFNLRLQLKTGKLEKHSKIGELKKDIARLLTVKKELSK